MKKLSQRWLLISAMEDVSAHSGSVPSSPSVATSAPGHVSSAGAAVSTETPRQECSPSQHGEQARPALGVLTGRRGLTPWPGVGWAVVLQAEPNALADPTPQTDGGLQRLSKQAQ